MRVAVIGDLMLDVLVEPLGPLRPGDDTPGRIDLQPGGQGANVAAWVAALGGQARLVCARSDLDGGGRGADALLARGVEVVGPVLPGGAGVVVSLISERGERTLISDAGCVHSLAADHLEDEWFDGCDWLHVSGYHVFDEFAVDAALRAGSLARARGARISLDLAYAARMRELGSEDALRRVALLGPDVVFLTSEEAEVLGEPSVAPVCVVKRGPHGCTLASGGDRSDLPAHPADVVDPTGAGDAFAAGFLTADVDDPLRAAEAGLAAAARCVSRVGAMPAERLSAESLSIEVESR